jgi:hypothetical protein
MMGVIQSRRSSDTKSLPRKLAVVIGDVLRLTNRSIQSLLGRRVEQVQREVNPQSLSLLRENILGNSKESLLEVFGTPPRVQLADGTMSEASDPMIADTWYFPLDPARGTILVIQFEDDHAIDAQFVDAPQIQ